MRQNGIRIASSQNQKANIKLDDKCSRDTARPIELEAKLYSINDQPAKVNAYMYLMHAVKDAQNYFYILLY